MKDYHIPSRGGVPGIVTEVLYPSSYLVEIADGIIRQHVDHIRKQSNTIPIEQSTDKDEDTPNIDLNYDCPTLQPVPTLYNPLMFFILDHNLLRYLLVHIDHHKLVEHLHVFMI